MYGQYVTIDGIKLWVWGVPDYTSEQWDERARVQLNGMSKADIHALGKLNGVRLGLEAAAQQCDGVPELRQAYTTDKNKAAGIKHAVNLCESRIRALSAEDIVKE